MSKRVLFSGMAALLAASVLVVPARADFIPIYDSSPPAGSPGKFFYTIDFSTTTDPGNGNAPSERLDPGSTILISGGSGITAAMIAPADSSLLSATLVGQTVLVSYTGPSTTTPLHLSDALILTAAGTTVTAGSFVGTDTRNSGPNAGTPVVTTGTVSVPGGTAVPEPSSIVLSLIGLGVCGLGLARRGMAQKA